MRMEAWSNARKRRIIKQTNETTNKGIKVSSLSANRKSDLYSTFVWTPIYYTSKICGLFPVKFIQNESGKYSGQLNKLQVVYGILLTLAFCIGQTYGLIRDILNRLKNITNYSTKTAITGTCIDVLAALSTTVTIILSSSHRWCHLKCVLDKLVDVDEKLNIATSTNLRKSIIKFISYTYIYVVTVCFLDFAVWPLYRGTFGTFYFTSLYLMYFIMYTFEMQYTLLLLNISERFIKLNKTILNTTKTNLIIGYLRRDMGLAAMGSRKRGSQKISSQAVPDLEENQHHNTNTVYNLMDSRQGPIDNPGAIDHLMNVYGILCDCVAEVNKAYGFAILVGTISCLVQLVITPYFLYYELFSPTNSNNWWLQLLWTTFHFNRLWLFVQPCYNIVLKARETGSLISQALANDWIIPNARKPLELFSIQLLQRPIEFTACGMFFLNRGLLTSVLGSVITLLAIMIQFQEAGDNEGTKTLLENASFYLRNTSSFYNYAFDSKT